jgi:Putative beta-barrel porin 2
LTAYLPDDKVALQSAVNTLKGAVFERREVFSGQTNQQKIMKKLFVSAGLVAIGAATFQTAKADNAGGDSGTISPKYWSVGATLRGFYDSDYEFNGRSSFGFEVLPTVSFHVPLQQTDIGLRYTYGLYYYADRASLDQNPIDQTHQVDLWVDHAFNERWRGRFTDTFAVGQEPELLNPNPVIAQSSPNRINGSNLSNHGNFALDTDWTRLFSTTLSYQNGWYSYDQNGAFFTDNPADFPANFPGQPNSLPSTPSGPYYLGVNNPPLFGPTYAGLLDRVEQDIALDLKWHYDPETTFLVGYQFGWTDYTGDEPIAVVPLPSNPAQNLVYFSDARNAYTSYFYVGGQHAFTPNLSLSARAGATYTDVYNDPLFPTTSWYPYADISLTYTYLPGSYLQFGFTQDVSATDQVSPNTAGGITQYANASVIYGDLNHRITSKLTGTVICRVQYNSYQGGSASDQGSTDYGVGVNLDYAVNRFLSVDAGYNFDDVVTEIPGFAYTRNRAYLGLSVNY